MTTRAISLRPLVPEPEPTDERIQDDVPMLRIEMPDLVLTGVTNYQHALDYANRILVRYQKDDSAYTFTE